MSILIICSCQCTSARKKKIKGIQFGKEKLELFKDMIIHVENLMDL